MKKLLLLALLVAGGVSTASADYGQYDASMKIGGVTTDPFSWSTSSDSPTDLGIMYNLTVESIAFNVWSDTNNRAGANMFFRIYDENGEKQGDDVDIYLGTATRIEGKSHDFSISWSEGYNLANAVGVTLEAGKTYFIDVWAKTYGGESNVDEWYSGGGNNFHAKLTYEGSHTRSVTSGNWGTLCLPFDATISGANVYTIASKVVDGSGNPTAINLNEVANNTVAAGKPYIFQATGSTLSATYSGSYAAASAGYGMMGNLSSTPVTVAVGKYVVKDNKVRKVVTGGTGVTIGQYRAYIDLEGVDVATSRSAFFLGSDDNETTGIENVQAEKSQNAVYNLNGQRVKDGQKGLLIVNGKKVMNK